MCTRALDASGASGLTDDGRGLTDWATGTGPGLDDGGFSSRFRVRMRLGGPGGAKLSGSSVVTTR